MAIFAAILLTILSAVIGGTIDKSPNGIGALFWGMGYIVGAISVCLVYKEITR